MKKQVLSTDLAPKAIGPYSQAAAFNSLLFISGQIPLDPETGEMVNDTFDAEMQQVLKNLTGMLQAAGLDASHVIKTTIFLVDMSDFAAANALYGEMFTIEPPARSTIQVSALPKGARVEIEAIAGLPIPMVSS